MSAQNRKTPACGAFRRPAAVFIRYHKTLSTGPPPGADAVKKYYFLTTEFAA